MTGKVLKTIKPFLNYEEQIDNLIERKGLVITDREFAVSKLEDISYYALIDGYKDLFYNPMTRKSLNKIINQYVKKTGNLHKDLFFNAMGFPAKWKNMNRYKL